LGQVAFGVANADQILMAREQEAHVVAVFAALQNSPRCILVHESSGIRSFDDLRDLVLALGEGQAFAEYIKARVPLTGVRIVSYAGTVAKFLVDQNYAQQAYVFSEPLVVAARGGDPHCLMVSDLGFNPYTSVLITSERLLAADRELVRRFVRATQRGWQAYLHDPTAANREMLAANSDMDASILEQAARQLKSLCLPVELPDDELGTMSSERWETLLAQLRELGLIENQAVKASDAFDNQLLTTGDDHGESLMNSHRQSRWLDAELARDSR
jgi:NitT/TauT family transport system substrate-binding protein